MSTDEISTDEISTDEIDAADEIRTDEAGTGEVAVAPREAASASRPRAVFIVTSMHGGGAEWVGRRWMEHLVRHGHDVLVVTTSDKSVDGQVPDGVRVQTLGRLRSHAAKVRRFRAVLGEERPDAVVGLQMYPNLIAVVAARSIPASRRPPVVVSEHNLVSFGLPGAGLTHRVKTWLARRAYPRADHVIAVSHAVAGEMVGGFGVREGRCTVVPNPAASKVAAVRPVLAPVPDLDVDLVVAHRLVPQKRPELAVLTAAELRRRGLRVRLTVFGQGPLLARMVSLAAESGVELDHRGWAEEWFADCSDRAVLLLASHREGFGNVLVEAAAAGIPSVALSSALGVADAVVPGLTGELASGGTPAALADAVERAARIRIGDLGGWLDRFSDDTSGAMLEQVLDSVRRERVPR